MDVDVRVGLLPVNLGFKQAIQFFDHIHVQKRNTTTRFFLKSKLYTGMEPIQCLQHRFDAAFLYLLDRRIQGDGNNTSETSFQGTERISESNHS